MTTTEVSAHEQNKEEELDEADAEPQLPVAVARALHSFDGETEEEVDLERDELVDIFGDLTEPWWYVRCQDSGRVGYAPRSHLLLLNDDITSLSGWFEVNRRESEYLLLAPGNQHGSYLIRPSSVGFYALSVKAKHSHKMSYFTISHYSIAIDGAGCYCVSQGSTFSSMLELLNYYSKCSNSGLCCQLTAPCLRERVPVELCDAEVNSSCIRLVELIGSGSVSDVHFATWNSTLQVAVKIKRTKTPENTDIIREAQLMVKLSDANIVRLLGITTIDVPSYYLILEYMENGNLLNYLRQDGGRGALTEEHLIHMMFQIASAMAYLERLYIIHRDLRAANILVGGENLVKVSDFGLARQTDVDGVYTCLEMSTFPTRWTPVEAATRGEFSAKSDVWSFGIVLWEIVTYGQKPYPKMANQEVLDSVARGYRMPNPNGSGVRCDQTLYFIMLECWRGAPRHRPSFGRLKEVLSVYFDVHKAVSSKPDAVHSRVMRAF